MDKLIKAQLEVSEKRTALSALLDAETPDTDAIETAKNEVTASEKRLQAVLVLDGGNKQVDKVNAGDAEGREIRQLVSKASVGRMLAGILEDGEGDGADRELRAALDIPSDYIPLSMLERRAALTTTGDEPGAAPSLHRAGIPTVSGGLLRRGRSECASRSTAGAGTFNRGNYQRAVHRRHGGGGDDRRYHPQHLGTQEAEW